VYDTRHFRVLRVFVRVWYTSFSCITCICTCMIHVIFVYYVYVYEYVYCNTRTHPNTRLFSGTNVW